MFALGSCKEAACFLAAENRTRLVAPTGFESTNFNEAQKSSCPFGFYERLERSISGKIISQLNLHYATLNDGSPAILFAELLFLWGLRL